MAITIIQERKKQRYLLLALAFIILAILLVVWLGFLRNKEPGSISMSPAVVYAAPDVNIDWQMLDGLRGEALQPFEEIGAFEGSFGRENPFEPY